MINDDMFYMVFFIIFSFWMLGKVFKHRKDERDRNDVMRILKNIESRLGNRDDQLDIGLINKEISETLKNKKRE